MPVATRAKSVEPRLRPTSTSRRTRHRTAFDEFDTPSLTFSPSPAPPTAESSNHSTPNSEATAPAEAGTKEATPTPDQDEAETPKVRRRTTGIAKKKSQNLKEEMFRVDGAALRGRNIEDLNDVEEKGLMRRSNSSTSGLEDEDGVMRRKGKERDEAMYERAMEADEMSEGLTSRRDREAFALLVLLCTSRRRTEKADVQIYYRASRSA